MQHPDPTPVERQTTLDEQVADVTGDSAAAIAAAIAEVRVRRAHVDQLRVQLADGVRDFNAAIAHAVDVGASLRELEEPSKLKKSYLSDVVALVRERAAKAAAKACPSNLIGGGK